MDIYGAFFCLYKLHYTIVVIAVTAQALYVENTINTQKTISYLSEISNIKDVNLSNPPDQVITELIYHKKAEDFSYEQRWQNAINRIALRLDKEYKFCYKYLFKMLSEYQKGYKGKILKFQNLFENIITRRKDLIFCFWLTLTFPDLNIKKFLKYSVEQMREKLKNSSDEKLKKAFDISFPISERRLNPNTSLILVKFYQYLDIDDKRKHLNVNDPKVKENILSLISHSCYTKPVFIYAKYIYKVSIPKWASRKLTTRNIREKFYQEVDLKGHKITFVYYKIPNTEIVIGITNGNYSKISDSEYIGYSKCNYFAYIILENPIQGIQPLTDTQIANSDETYGSIFLANPHSPSAISNSNYYYSPNIKGLAYILDENGESHSIKEVLQENKDILDAIKENYDLVEKNTSLIPLD